MEKYVVKVTTTVDFKGKLYVPGKEYDVDKDVVVALGAMCTVIKKPLLNVPSTDEVKESLSKKVVKPADQPNQEEKKADPQPAADTPKKKGRRRGKAFKAPKNAMVTGTEEGMKNA